MKTEVIKILSLRNKKSRIQFVSRSKQIKRMVFSWWDFLQQFFYRNVQIFLDVTEEEIWFVIINAEAREAIFFVL